jgi:hypothetical protein
LRHDEFFSHGNSVLFVVEVLDVLSVVIIDLLRFDLTLRRRGYKSLIPAVYDANIRESELVAANRCRLYLRVVTLADNICDGLGDHVTDAAWLGHRDTDRPQYYEWPAQGYPSGGNWTIWRKPIARVFDVSNHSRALPLALGPWTDPPDTWRWFHSDNDDRLYYRSAPNKWQFCIRHPHRQRNYELSANWMSSSL